MKTVITSVLLSLLLTGCGLLKTKPVDIQTTPTERIPLNLPGPSPLGLNPVKWIIITPENMKDVWARIQASGSDLVLFSITPAGYEQLSMDMLQIRQYIIMQNDIIAQYKKYYESSAESIK